MTYHYFAPLTPEQTKTRIKVLKSPALREAERSIQEFIWNIKRKNTPPDTHVREIQWVHVYELVDPRDGAVFYIGKGTPRRLQDHEREAERGWLSAKCIKIREIWLAGHQVEFRTIALFNSHQKALAHEAKLIRENDAAITNNKPYGKWNDGLSK